MLFCFFLHGWLLLFFFHVWLRIKVLVITLNENFKDIYVVWLLSKLYMLISQCNTLWWSKFLCGDVGIIVGKAKEKLWFSKYCQSIKQVDSFFTWIKCVNNQNPHPHISSVCRVKDIEFMLARIHCWLCLWWQMCGKSCVFHICFNVLHLKH